MRVMIIKKSHPWYGMVGETTGEVIHATKQEIIELDNGMSTAVLPGEVKQL